MSEFADHPAIKAIKTLNNHSESILDAINNNNAVIPFNEENSSILNSLFKAELGYYDSENNLFYLYNHVISFVAFYEKKQRISCNSKQIVEIIEDIRSDISDYLSIKLQSMDDADRIKDDIGEKIILLANTIYESTNNFANQVLRNLALFNNLNVRIRRIQKSITTLNELTNVVSVLSVSAMDELGASNTDLERLVNQRLKPVVDQCCLEAINSAERLNTQLFEWQQDQKVQKLGNMVDAFHRFINSKNPISHDFDEYEAADPFFKIPATELVGRADIDSLLEQDALQSIGLQAYSKQEKDSKVIEPRILEPMRDCIEIVEIELSALDIAIGHFFEAMHSGHDAYNKMSAITAYSLLDLDCEIGYWVIRIVNHFRTNHQDTLRMEFIEEPDSVFNGNFTVKDVIFSQLDN